MGVFSQSALVAGYNGNDVEDDLAMQSLLTFAPGGGLRLTGGLFYATLPGASPTVGMQYLRPGRQWLVLVSPRVNVEAHPPYSVFSILRYTGASLSGRALYLSLQALNTFGADQHIKSYQWLRAGLDVRGTQFGLGVNLDEYGPNPRVKTRVGVFVRREVF